MEEEEREIKSVDDKRHFFNKEDKRKKFFSKLTKVLTILTIWIFLAVMIFLIVFMIKYKNTLNTDALNYGMELHNFTSCTCISADGKYWNSINNSQGFIHKENVYWEKENIWSPNSNDWNKFVDNRT